MHKSSARLLLLAGALAAASSAQALTIEITGQTAPVDAEIFYQHDIVTAAGQSVRFRPALDAFESPNTSGSARSGEISDKGQTFTTGGIGFTLGALTLQFSEASSYTDNDTVAGATAGTGFRISLYEITNSTNGIAPGSLLFTTSANLPATWNSLDFVRFNFTGIEQVNLAANTQYGFLFELTSMVGNLRFDHSTSGNAYAGGAMFRREGNSGTSDPTEALRVDSNFDYSSDVDRDFTFYVAAIPEPSSAAALAGVAMLGLAALRRRRA